MQMTKPPFRRPTTEISGEMDLGSNSSHDKDFLQFNSTSKRLQLRRKAQTPA
jgi:hypothetical protein